MRLTSSSFSAGTNINNFNDKNKNNRNQRFQFFDLGSGGGRLVIQSHLEIPSVVKSVGIELSPSRHAIAIQTWQGLLLSGEAKRIRQLAEKAFGISSYDNNAPPQVELHEGDLFLLDISEATHMYVSSLCFSENMLERLVDKIEREGTALQTLASLRLLPLKNRKLKQKCDDSGTRKVELGSNPWMEFVEMSWTKARGDGCPVYFYSVKKLDQSE